MSNQHSIFSECVNIRKIIFQANSQEFFLVLKNFQLLSVPVYKYLRTIETLRNRDIENYTYYEQYLETIALAI